MILHLHRQLMTNDVVCGETFGREQELQEVDCTEEMKKAGGN